MPMPRISPISMPLSTMNTANQRKVFLTSEFLAPRVFSSPITVVRSSIMMSSPLTIVNPATHTINMRIIHTLRSSKSSHENISGLMSLTVRELRVLPSLSSVLFTLSIMRSSTTSMLSKSFTSNSQPVTSMFPSLASG